MRNKLVPIYIDSREIQPEKLGFLETTRDEQIAKKIYQATGDLFFKKFLPFSWNTAAITKMRDIAQRLEAQGKLTAFNMAMQFPSASMAAHQYFITNEKKIKGLLPDNLTLDPGAALKALNPLLLVAGIATAAFLFVQIKPFFKAEKA